MLKNSFFANVVIAFLNFISDLYKNSLLSKIVDSVFGFFSKAWKNSWFSSVFASDSPIKCSIAGSVYKFKKIYITFGKWLNRSISGSFIYNIAKDFTDSALALNTRFLGCLLCSSAVGYCLCLIAFGGSVSVFAVAVLVLGAVFSLFNKNLTDIIKRSGIVNGLLKLLGFDFEFNYKFREISGYALLGGVAVGLLSGLALYKSLILCLLAIFGILGALLVLMYPVAGAFAAVFSAPFVPTMVLVAMVLYVFISFVIHSIARGTFPVSFKTTGVLLCVFIGVNAVSAVTSFTTASSIQVFAVTAALSLTYFVISGCINSKKLIYALLRIFVISSVIVAAYGILQYLFGWGLDVKNAWIDEEMFEDATVRVYSTLGNPNVLGEYILLAIFPCLAFIFHGGKRYSRAIYTVFFGVLASCLILTQSRGCWIGFILGAAIYVTFKQGRLWGLLPFALIAAPMLLPETIIARFSSIGDLNDTSSSYRMYIWLGTIEMLKDFWLFGVGQGQIAFNAIYPFYSYSAITAPHAHNLYLQIFAESGIGALAVFSGMIIAWFKKITAVFRKDKGLFGSAGLLIASGMAAYLAEGMFDYVFYNHRVTMIFWAVLGLGMAMYKVTEVQND